MNYIQPYNSLWKKESPILQVISQNKEHGSNRTNLVEGNDNGCSKLVKRTPAGGREDAGTVFLFTKVLKLLYKSIVLQDKARQLSR